MLIVFCVRGTQRVRVAISIFLGLGVGLWFRGPFGPKYIPYRYLSVLWNYTPLGLGTQFFLRERLGF